MGSRAGTIMAGASILKITVGPARPPPIRNHNPRRLETGSNSWLYHSRSCFVIQTQWLQISGVKDVGTYNWLCGSVQAGGQQVEGTFYQ